MRDYHHFLFYATGSSSDYVELAPDESRHAVKVLRLTIGDKFLASCGDGVILTCLIESIEKDLVHASIAECTSIKKAIPHLHCYIGLPNRDAFEEMLTNLTAMGISQITPLITEHCQKNWWEHKWEKHHERFKTKMITAMKQSLYPYIPILHDPLPVKNFFIKPGNHALVADISGSPIHLHKDFMNNSIDCLIGPPGGFSEKEIDILKLMNCTFINIAPTRLRTELAAIVMCAQVIGSGIEK